jgi:hypothetical protein
MTDEIWWEREARTTLAQQEAQETIAHKSQPQLTAQAQKSALSHLTVCPQHGHHEDSRRNTAKTPGSSMLFSPSDHSFTSARHCVTPTQYDQFGTRGGIFSPGKSIAGPYADTLELIQRAALVTPGPGRYNPRRVGERKANGKFSDALFKSEFEEIEHRSRKQPGPGQYQAKILKSQCPYLMSDTHNYANGTAALPFPIFRQPVLAQNGRLATATRSTTFGTGTPKTELDWIIFRARQLPGPGAYVSNLGTIARRAAPNKTFSPTTSLSYTSSLAEETGKL